METIENDKVTKLLVMPRGKQPAAEETPNRTKVVDKLLRDVLEQSSELDAAFVLYVKKDGTHSISYNFRDIDTLIGLLVRAQSYLIKPDN
jgi:hypothetical protein